ncbi:CobW family GTP-binding protein [Ectobacillus panaciterrae]|uniref:CobW family GTP-binding protein n=1 Tax=Ectobacillus panaciterrae TaxID=363872 RepID=UPI00040C06F1|nr:GTP-binding protein [Ectobacillus panaciterrae]
MRKIPIYILSGFLGSGKTTLLKQLIQEEQRKNKRIGVIMNEIGKISIDSNEIPAEIPLCELLNGCICCSIRGRLETQLLSFIQEHSLDAIYIECTGVAHPIEVLEACTSPLLVHEMYVKNIITVVDSLRWKERTRMNLRMQKLLVEQVKYGNIIVLNKTEELKIKETQQIIEDILHINSDAYIRTVNSEGDMDALLINNTRSVTVQEHETCHSQNDLHIKTFVYDFNYAVQKETFENWLSTLPSTIYRIKGYIQFYQDPNVYLFQYSYRMPEYIKQPMEFRKTLVFIGEQLKKDEIRKELAQMEYMCSKQERLQAMLNV